MIQADEVLLVDDDSSRDETIEVAKKIGIRHIISHDKNKGYGANDNPVTEKLLNWMPISLSLCCILIINTHQNLFTAMCTLIAHDLYDVVLGSRILSKGALKGGMPLYKYIANRFLTLSQNLLMNQKLSEYHTGYRAYNRKVIESIDYNSNSNDFIFDNQLLAQIFYKNCEIAEITCPTKYFKEASSINFRKKHSIWLREFSLKTSLLYFLHKKGLLTSKLFQ